MNTIKTLIVILMLAASVSAFFSCARSDSTSENINMEQQIYTLGAWYVQEGRQQEFIEAWKELGTIFGALPDPPGKGILIQSASDPTLFYSFGPWSSPEAVEAMRGDQRAGEGIQKLINLCTKAAPGTYHVVAESP